MAEHPHSDAVPQPARSDRPQLRLIAGRVAGVGGDGTTPSAEIRQAQREVADATGIAIDPAVRWDVTTLTELGCPPAVARAAARVLSRPAIEPANEMAPPEPDPAPAIDIASVAIPGLAPIGVPPTPPHRERRDWRRWATRRHG